MYKFNKNNSNNLNTAHQVNMQLQSNTECWTNRQ